MESSRKRGPERLAAGARALLGGLALAVALLAVPASALAAQTESGTCDGKLVATVQGTQGGGSGSGEQGGQSGSPETGEPGVAAAALAAAAGLALAAAGALVVARSRAAAGHAAETGLPAGASLPLAAAVALALAAALLFGLSARSALADEDAFARRAAVSAAVTVDASGNVVSSEVTFTNQSSSRLTVTGVSAPELGGAIASTIDGLQVAKGTQARGALSVTSVSAELLAKAKAAGGTVEVDMSADYTYESFDIAFESNGGSDVATQKVAEGEATPEPAVPTREGYDFKGWYADEALATAYDFSAPVEADATAYAKWETSTYQVTYMSNGEQYFEETVEHGSTVCGPDKAPERDGYLFLGWYADEALETLFDYRAPITSDTTVYAKWEVNTYPVSFDTDGGTKVDEQVVEYGSTATDPAEQPTKVGYTFAGWYSDAALTQAYDFSTPVTSPVTLHAAWQVKTYTVTFRAGEHGSNLTQSVTYGSAASEPTLSATGYHVTGWYADAELTQPYDFSAMVTSDLDLYAKWEINTYTVTFDAAGGSEVVPQTVTYGDKVAEPAAPTKEGCLFKGWYYDEDAAVEVDFGIAVTSDATYHAKWADAVTVSYDLGYKDAPAVEASVIEKGAAVDKLPAPTRAGYTFDGWFADGSDTAATAETTFDASTKLTAHWTARTDTTYTVTYHFSPRVEGGEGVVGSLPYTGTTGEMTDINMPEKLFGLVLAEPVVQQEIKGDGSTNVDVYYDREEYAVTFYQEQGDTTPIGTGKVRFLGPLSSVKPADPTRDNYNFLGWYRLSPNGDGTYSKVYVSWETDTMSYYPEKDYPYGLCLYADWELSGGKATYTVNHVFEKADGSTTTESYVLTGTVGEKTTAEPRDFEGYSVQPFEQEEIKDGGATTVTITYRLKRGTVTFDANGHGEDRVVEKVAYGADLTGLAPTLSADGYDFGGWYTDEDCKNSFDFASSSMGEGDLTLYAKWTARTDTKYTVNHYQQDVEGDGYTLVETETLTGTTGGQAAYTAREYTGFDAPAEVSEAIAGDGSTVVDVKYDRKSIEVMLWEDSTTKYETRTVRYGATLADPGWEKDGCYIDSLTYDNGAGLTGTFDFSMPIDETVLGDKTQVLITGRWKQYADSYWIAPASSITTSNSSVQVANANYTNPEAGIIKDRLQIQKDVEKIAAGDAATIAEYTEYMTSDSYHLYTKVGTGTSTNDYAEFRIIQVGSHDGDGSSLTFQATSSVFDASMNGSENTNEGGWEASSLRASMGEGGSVYSKLSTTLTSDIMAVAKKSLSPKATSWVYAEGLSTTFDKLWLPSWSEVYGEGSAATLTYSSRSAFTSQYTYEGAQYAYYKAAGVSSDASNPNNAALVPLMRNRDGSNGEGSLLRTAALEQENWFCQVNSDGRGRADEDATRPAQAGATDSKKIAPCFSFGTSAKRTVSFVTNGGSAVEAQQVANGSAVAEAATTKDGCEFVGWYTDAAITQPYVLGATPVTANTVLYACWTEAESSVTDSYWLAPSYKYTNGNADTVVNQVYNADCELNPQGHVIKDRAQILFDKTRLYAGDKAASVEYTYYMLTDTVHLYTKTRSEGTANDFNEFRIVNVGRHDNENGMITFQMSTANYSEAAMSEPTWSRTWSYKTSDMNSYLNNKAGSDIGQKLYSEISYVDKTFTSCTRDSDGISEGLVTVYGWARMWLASISEIGGDYDSVHNSEGSQYQYFRWHGATNDEKHTISKENGLIEQLCYNRSGDRLGHKDYCIWTRSVYDSNDFTVGKNNKTYYAYEMFGRIDTSACCHEALTSEKLAFSPCFCF